MACSAGPDIVESGLVLALDAADRNSYSGSGTTWTDLSGNGNNGTLNGAGYNSGNGGSISFDGTDDWVSTSFNPNLNNNRLYTYEIWFKDNIAGGFLSNTALISNYGASSTTPNSVLHIQDTGIIFFSERNTNSTSNSVYSPSSIVDNTWKHIVATASSSNLSLYVNGVSVATPSSRPGGVITSGQNFVIGGNHLGRYQSCNISIVGIYMDKALSASEIQQNFNMMRGRFGI